ncbi:ABC transporter ATP-binding protein [Naumannella halotolerans]|uniref:ABC transporter ATP-binding protein n=1 Tax=Naumannella halotolerans TaxID=993414 RepID=UPI001AAF7B9E|nr:ABC transporter ATP-binding protein [Naumannella halotolerans]
MPTSPAWCSGRSRWPAPASRDLDEAARATIAGRGALVVAHRLSQAAIADRIVVLEHGRIVESGGHDALVEAGGRYAELWRAWAG